MRKRINWSVRATRVFRLRGWPRARRSAAPSYRGSRPGTLGAARQSRDRMNSFAFSMNKLPYIPGSAPFTPEQRAWLNGYLAGLFADANVGEVAAPPRSASEEKRTEALLVM